MLTISKYNHVVTLINVFTVEPKNQQKLVDLLMEATEKTMFQTGSCIFLWLAAAI